MNVLDLFSGIGGFSLGLERAGMRTVAFCEIDPYCRKVLAKHWPNVPIHHDVTKLRGSEVGPVDVICGGFPCQDISSAGNRVGIEGDRSGLWKEYARIIGELRPRFVIVENVAALLGRGLDRVLGDMAALGYDAEWHCIPASAIGARHRRDRIWIVAYPEGYIRRTPRHDIAFASHGTDDHVADTERGRLQGRDVERSWSSAIIPAEISRYCRGSEFGAPWRIEPDVGRVAYGVSDGMDRFKGLGNAVVPQLPELLGRAIMRSLSHPSQHGKTP